MQPALRSRLALPLLSLFVGIGCSNRVAARRDVGASSDTRPSPDAPGSPSPDQAARPLPDGADLPADGLTTRPDAVAEHGSDAEAPPPLPMDGGDSAPVDAGGDTRLPPQDDAPRTDTASGPDTHAAIDSDSNAPAARILLIDRNTDTFATYDRDGQRVHDYHALLTFDSADDDKPWISLAGNMAHWTTASEIVTDVYWVRPATGWREPPRPSTLVVGQTLVDRIARYRLGSIAGDLLATVDLPGSVGSAYTLSPGERHLVVGSYVYRLSDQREVHRPKGAGGGISFSPDDKHLIAAQDTQIPFELVDLESGRITQPDLSALPFPFSTDRDHVFVKAALDAGAVFMVDFGYGETLTRQLWWVDWEGHLTPLDPALPQYALDEFVRFDAAGTKVLWYRTTSMKSPSFPIGHFAFDLSTLKSHAWKDVGQAQRIDSTDCFAGGVETFYGVVGGTLLACDCTTGSCRQFAELPPTTLEWEPAVVISPDRSVVGVQYYWTISSREPTSGGDAQLFRATGEPLATVPNGWIEFDKNSSLAMLIDFLKDTEDKGVLNLATGGVTWFGPARQVAIAYE